MNLVVCIKILPHSRRQGEAYIKGIHGCSRYKGEVYYCWLFEKLNFFWVLHKLASRHSKGTLGCLVSIFVYHMCILVFLYF